MRYSDDLAFSTVAALDWYPNPGRDFEELVAEHKKSGPERAIRKVQKSPFAFDLALRKKWSPDVHGENGYRKYIFSKSRKVLGSVAEGGHVKHGDVVMAWFEFTEMQARDEKMLNCRQEFHEWFQTTFAGVERTIQ